MDIFLLLKLQRWKVSSDTKGNEFSIGPGGYTAASETECEFWTEAEHQVTGSYALAVESCCLQSSLLARETSVSAGDKNSMSLQSSAPI